MKRLLILGSTGSIGVQALDVVSRSSDLDVVGLSCGSKVDLLLEQAVSLGVQEVAVASEAAASRLTNLYPEIRVRTGPGAAARLVREVEADLVLNAVVGFAGLEATLATLALGRRLALANKESLVSGGRVVTGLAGQRGVRILPVDSEHSALFQLVAGESPGAVADLVLTASGGPFRGRTRRELAGVTPEAALAHPTWDMGAKISIDSATLMNKGLEIIEAHHLFAVPYENIEVLLHPRSLVHSLVRLVDGALLAHLGVPDMRVPIAYALHYPERRPLPVAALDLAEIGLLEFARPDLDAFPALGLAVEAGKAGDAATCALNAANEVAVHAFLAQRISFLGIPEVVAGVLDRTVEDDPHSYEEIAAIDARSRQRAGELCRSLAGREP